MAPRCLAGVESGGTKLAVGLVDQDLRSERRVQRPADGHDSLNSLDSVPNALQALINEAPGAAHSMAVAGDEPSIRDVFRTLRQEAK